MSVSGMFEKAVRRVMRETARDSSCHIDFILSVQFDLWRSYPVHTPRHVYFLVVTVDISF